MIKDLLDGLKSRLKGVGEKGGSLPPAGGMPPSPILYAPPSPGMPMPQMQQPYGQPQAPPRPQDDLTSLLGGPDTAELENKVKALEDKTSHLESVVKETLDISKSNKSRLDSIDTNMKKFISLYELVTNQINPFVDAKPPFQKEKQAPAKKEPVVEEEETVEEAEPEPAMEPKPKLAKLSAADGEQVMFMQSIKDGNASFVLEWITSLVGDDGNVDKNAKLLKYLLNLGWITPKAYEALMQHMQALAAAGRLTPQARQMIPIAVGADGRSMPFAPQGREPPGMTGIQLPPMGDSDSLMRVLDWVKYLVDKVGYAEAMDILKYLVQLGWITPDAHEALLRYIDKSNPPRVFQPNQAGMQPAQLRPESRVLMQPNQIPTPADFMAAERAEYRIPIQPTMEQPSQFHPEPQQVLRDRHEPWQHQHRPPTRQHGNAVIPLTELGSDIESLAIILEWIRHIVDKAGTNGARNIFDYYARIGWVSEDVYQQLMNYVDGIRAGDEEDVDYQPTVEDHATSLFFIGKLKKVSLSDQDINKILGK